MRKFLLILAALALAGCTAAEYRAAKQDIANAVDDVKTWTRDMADWLGGDRTQKRPDP